MKPSSVVCVGELLIDFICTDINVDLLVGKHFLKSAGGAPANVAASIAKLGGNALFCGKVGQDPFGYFLKKTLEDVHVDTSMLMMDKTASTTLAFVSLKKNGERDFVFNRGADGLLTIEDVDLTKLSHAKLLHFGSATALLSDPFCSTYLQLMEEASQLGQWISFDPNFRMDLWKDSEQAFVEKAKRAAAFSHMTKVSEEELKLITGTEDLVVGAGALHDLGVQLIMVTLGKKGTFISTGDEHHLIPSILVNSIDSTGAGDAFVGATLYQLAQLDSLDEIISNASQLVEMIRFSNKVGAIVCTKMGAIASLPTYSEVVNWEEEKN